MDKKENTTTIVNTSLGSAAPKTADFGAADPLAQGSAALAPFPQGFRDESADALLLVERRPCTKWLRIAVFVRNLSEEMNETP